MIKRKAYLAAIRGFYQSDLIKVITGVRRCGKSVILEQIMDEIRQTSNNIVFLNFEDRSVTSTIKTTDDLIGYVDSKREDGLCFVFLDEVQEVDGWAEACKTLRLHNCSMFITGSNSKLLSREFIKELSGRYVSFRIRPFVYKELLEYATELGKDVPISDYIVWGGFPKRLELNTVEDQRRYLNDLNDTIVVNDIISRYQIRKTSEFEKVADFVLVSNARLYSANTIAENLRKAGTPVSANTVQKWVDYMSEAYVIDRVDRYSRKAKGNLAQSRKLYNCDVSLNSIHCTDNRFDVTHNLENIIYNELLFRGYSVSVYDNKGREVDFLAQKGSLRYYIQVAYSVAEDSTYQREFSAFKSLSQLDRKIIITNDDIDYSTSNVEHIKLKDFLLMDDLK